MKRAKIMLLALAVFVVLGAVLAFKAKTYDVVFCTKTLPVENAPATSICNAPELWIGQIVPGEPNMYATWKDMQNQFITSTIQCSAELVCPSVRGVEY